MTGNYKFDFFLKEQQFLVLGGELYWISACARLHPAGPLFSSSPCPQALPYTFIWSIEIHHLEQYFCLGIFCFQSKGCSFIGRCGKIANHSQEDLAKSGYKSSMKYKSFIVLLYFSLYTGKNKIERTRDLWQWARGVAL
jgi:hypothetical protein